MSDLYFPQLTSGAAAQFPISKTRLMRTIKNALADGSVILYPDTGANRLFWQFSYLDLSPADALALQAHFAACAGPVHAFTFIDPTDNMLASSANFGAAPWLTPSTITVTSGVTDPQGGSAAFTVTNNVGGAQVIAQILAVPANYQYCFSIYARGAHLDDLTLSRSGPSPSLAETTSYQIGPAWTRLISSGRLGDGGTTFTVGINLEAGQQVSLYGPQLEAQIAPSRYRATTSAGGVYATAHWITEELIIASDAPDLYSTAFSIEATLQD